MCYLMTTFRCPSDILITSWFLTAWWSTWPGNHLNLSLYCSHSGDQKISLLGTTPPKHNRSKPNSVCMHRSRADNVQEILDAIGPLGARTTTAKPVSLESKTRRFFGNFPTATFRQIWPQKKRKSRSPRNVSEGTFENFPSLLVSLSFFFFSLRSATCPH